MAHNLKKAAAKKTWKDCLSKKQFVISAGQSNASGLISSSETINHPQHYGGDTTYEAIKVIHAWELGFSLGNAVKYIARAGKKDPDKEIEDLEKAVWYVQDRIKELRTSPLNKSKKR